MKTPTNFLIEADQTPPLPSISSIRFLNNRTYQNFYPKVVRQEMGKNYRGSYVTRGGERGDDEFGG